MTLTVSPDPGWDPVAARDALVPLARILLDRLSARAQLQQQAQLLVEQLVVALHVVAEDPERVEQRT